MKKILFPFLLSVALLSTTPDISAHVQKDGKGTPFYVFSMAPITNRLNAVFNLNYISRLSHIASYCAYRSGNPLAAATALVPGLIADGSKANELPADFFRHALGSYVATKVAQQALSSMEINVSKAAIFTALEASLIAYNALRNGYRSPVLIKESKKGDIKSTTKTVHKIGGKTVTVMEEEVNNDYIPGDVDLP